MVDAAVSADSLIVAVKWFSSGAGGVQGRADSLRGTAIAVGKDRRGRGGRVAIKPAGTWGLFHADSLNVDVFACREWASGRRSDARIRDSLISLDTGGW